MFAQRFKVRDSEQLSRWNGQAPF